LLSLGHFVAGDDADLAASFGIEDRERPPQLRASKTEDSLFGFVILHICFQGFNEDRVFGFFRSDLMPSEML
jgi:hypothetical protein